MLSAALRAVDRLAALVGLGDQGGVIESGSMTSSRNRARAGPSSMGVRSF
ncbi:MAG TPA: hypothetical protein VFJ61_00995 [Solirubrobacterales bacterium]|nr:hypothetical protein [Solirubrobacterales bacterium]